MSSDVPAVGIRRILFLFSLKGALGETTVNEFDEEKASIIVCLAQWLGQWQRLASW